MCSSDLGESDEGAKRGFAGLDARGKADHANDFLFDLGSMQRLDIDGTVHGLCGDFGYELHDVSLFSLVLVIVWVGVIATP